jgi:hypothetical protein
MIRGIWRLPASWRIRWAIIGLLLVCANEAEGQQGADAQVLSGCYALQIGQWERGNYPFAFVAPPRSPPDTFRLLPNIDDRYRRPGHEHRPVEPAWPGFPNEATWERRGADSVRIQWGAVFTGVTLQMRVHPDSLVGVVNAGYRCPVFVG